MRTGMPEFAHALKQLKTISGLSKALRALPDLSSFAGEQLDLKACSALFGCHPPHQTHEVERDLQAVYKRTPFDASAWLRIVFPWVPTLEKGGVHVEPPRAAKPVGKEESDAVEVVLRRLISDVRKGTARRSKQMTKRLDGLAMLSPRANRERAVYMARTETRKTVSIAELRIEAQRIVQLSGAEGAREWKGRDAEKREQQQQQQRERSPSPTAEHVRSRLEALDAELFRGVSKSTSSAKGTGGARTAR